MIIHWDAIDNKVIWDLVIKYGLGDLPEDGWLNKIIENAAPLTALKIVEVYPSSYPGIHDQKMKRLANIRQMMYKMRFNRTLQVLIEQLYEFPNGEHDDMLDALLIAIDVSRRYIPLKIA